MNIINLVLVILVVNSIVYVLSIRKFLQPLSTTSGGYTKPSYRAWYMGLIIGTQTLIFIAILLTFGNKIILNNLAHILILVLAAIFCYISFTWGWKRLKSGYNARKSIEKVIKALLLLCSAIAILVTVGIVLSMVFETFKFFGMYPITEFLFGLHWSPQTAIREDQVGSTGAFGFIPLISGTLVISFVAMMLAGPIGFLSAIFLGEYSSPLVRKIAKPSLEVLAGIPTVVYGFFAALWVAPLIRDTAYLFGIEASSQSALAAGLVMGIMLIPFVCSLSDDVIKAVPQSLRNSSYALGATRSETILKVVVPAALPGIVGGLLLATSRAIGETMIVLMAAGFAAKLSANPLDSMTTVTVQITKLLTGDQEFDSAKTLSAFALGITLFISTLLLNIIALVIVRKYRETYE